MTAAGAFTIPLGHPSLPGHFPGNPVIPGVLLLAEVFALLGAAHPGMRVATLLHAKFLRPVRPGETVALASLAKADDRVEFTGLLGGEPALRGAVRMSPA